MNKTNINNNKNYINKNNNNNNNLNNNNNYEILKGKNIPGFYGLDKDAPVEKEEEFDLNVLDNIIN